MTYFALVLTMVLWGNSFVATKFILETLSPVQYIFVRFALAALLFIPVLLMSRPRRLTFRQHRSFMLIALFEPGLYFLFETYGLRLTTASSASLIIACIPAFVALTAGLVLRERLSRRAWIGIVVSIIGVAAIAILDGAQEAAAGSIIGNVLVLCSVFAATGYIIVARKVSAGLSPLEITAYQVMYGALYFLPFFLLSLGGHLASGELPSIGGDVVGAMVFLVIGPTFLAFLCYNYALSRIPASRAAVFLNGIPVVTVIVAALLLGERLTMLQIVGGIVVIIGVTLTASRGATAAADPILDEAVPPPLG